MLTDSETRSGSEIRVRTRSLFGIMHYLSQNVKVPLGDREIVKISEINNGESCDKEAKSEMAGTVAPLDSNRSRIERYAASDDLFRSQYCWRLRFGRCQTYGHWFYIASKDHRSKATFALLTKLFEIQISGRETNQGIFLVQ